MSEFKIRTALAKWISKELLSDDWISLKHVFDNLRNFVICAGLFASARWLDAKLGDKSSTLLWGFTFPEIRAVLAIWVLGFVLLALNIAQAYEVCVHLLDQLVDLIEEIGTKKGTGWKSALYWLAVLFAIALAILYVITMYLLFGWALWGPTSAGA